MTQQTSFFGLGGGLDLITPAVQLPPGRVIAGLNYEPVAAGYRRLRGFERYDGRAAPSGVTGYHVIHFTGGDSDLNSVVQGSEITNASVSANLWRCIAVAVPVITSGTTGAGTAAGYIGVTFVADTSIAQATGVLRLQPGSVAFATLDGAAIANEAVVEAASGAWLAAAKAARRGLITAVPGSGSVRGVWFVAGEVIAVRDNAGATAGILHKDGAVAANQGWAAVALSLQFTFNSGGTYEPIAGNLITGDTSTATGVIKAATLTSGSWAAGTAAGTITILVGIGTFASGENITVIDGALVYANNLTLTNAGTAYTLPVGGAYEFLNFNFYGASDLVRTYGVNGVGPAFEYDVTTSTLSPILTGMTVDTPNHLAAHKGSLFLSFPGGSLQFSAVGEPLTFDPIVGAGEIGVGSDITALVPTSGALAILAENSISLLYGNDSSDYQLEVLTYEAGALPHTAQKFGGQVYYMDLRGVRTLNASQAYGNFSFGAVSQLIEPLLKDFARDNVEPVARLVSRSANQIWYFFSNGSGLIFYLGAKQPSILPFNLGKTVTCAASVEDEGEERLFIGCSDGFVYELNKGTSFDGAVIEHYIRLPFNHFGSPQQLKRFHKVSIDLEASGTTTLSVSAEINLGSEAGIDAQTLAVTTGGGAIDGLGSNELYFASQIETIAEAFINGVAKNISLKIAGSTSTEEPHTLTGVTYHVSPRGLQR